MPSFNDMAIRLYRRFFNVSNIHPDAKEADAVIDGNSAIAFTEACIADVAVLGGTASATGAALAWRHEVQRLSSNLFSGALNSQDTEGPRGALAAAIGQSMAGRRATAFLSAPDLAAAQDLLANAAGRHLPLVIHLNNQALPAQGQVLGTGHEALHQAADSGCFILFAANVQEAVDFTLIARKVAEAALIPGLVVMDGDRTALSTQELHLPSPGLIHDFLGASSEQIDSPTPAQEILFGKQRPRVPRWHDLDRPMLQGSLQDPTTFALGVAGDRPYFDQHLDAILTQTFEQFAKLSGRRYSELSSQGVEGASLVLVAQGSAVETAEAVARQLGKKAKLKTGVLGIHCLRPFPGAKLISQLSGKASVAVLERLDTPLAGDPPLLRELRAGLDRALENSRFGEAVHPGYPELDAQQRPTLHSAIYGTGGLPLDAAELIHWCKDLKGKHPSRVYLGIAFHNSSNAHPKRQVLLDRIRRAYPDIEQLGVRLKGERDDSRPNGTLTLKVYRQSGRGGETIAAEAGSMLQHLDDGSIRTLPGLSWDDWAGWSSDLLHHTPEGSGDPGDNTPVDFALACSPENLASAQLHQALIQNAGLLVAGADNDDRLWRALGAETRAAISSKSLALYHLPPQDLPDYSIVSDAPSNAEMADAYLLGGLFAALQKQTLIDQTLRRIQATLEKSLEGLSDAEQTALTSTFEAGFEALRQVETSQFSHPVGSSGNWSDDAPLAIQHLGTSDRTIGSLPRFWDQVGILHRDGSSDTLTADPFLSTGAIPPLSATFRDLSEPGSAIPAFSPEACTGCGDCWTACPDSAIGVVAMTPSSLVNGGIQMAGADAVRQIGSKLAARISALGRSGDTDGNLAGELLGQAWDWLQQKAPLPEERKATIQEGFDSLVNQIGNLPMAITDGLFHEGEKEKKDGGALLSLVINPEACKRCGICIATCEPEALTAAARTADEIEQDRTLWRTWQKTPDTESHTIEHAIETGTLDPMAALLMSRYCSQAMAGGDGAEAGSGEKIALRMALSATEYQQQPLQYRFTQELNEARNHINELIQETLTDALPTDDLATLAENLQQVQGRHADLTTLTQRAEGSGIDTQRITRLVELAQNLGAAYWRLSEGKQGLGRARFGLAVAPGTLAQWAGVFPNNPFQAPVTLDMTGDAAQLAAGLLQGQLAEAVDTLNQLHQANKELGKNNKDQRHTLTWDNLTDDERRLCPPLFLVGSEAELGGRGFTQVAWLLNSGMPVKILVLSELDLGLDTQGVKAKPLASSQDARTDLGLMALAQRQAYVAQSSIAEPGHFRQSLKEALSFTGPALIRLHAPSPQRHGFTTDKTLEQAAAAVRSRAFPLFRYHPEEDGVFGSRITLEGNPEPQQAWVANDAEEPITPLSWAAAEERFASHFSTLEQGAASPIKTDDWLALEAGKRAGKTPFVEIDQEESTQRCQVSTELMAEVEKLSHIWRTLQELAGLVTPFTERVNREAEARVAEEHQAELDALKKEHERQIQAVRDGVQGDMAGQLRNRLMSLAGYK